MVTKFVGTNGARYTIHHGELDFRASDRRSATLTVDRSLWSSKQRKAAMGLRLMDDGKNPHQQGSKEAS